jgi:lysophospholipase L1-like esterase
MGTTSVSEVQHVGRRLLLAALLVVIIAVTGCGSGSSSSNGPPPPTWHLLSLGDSIPFGGDDCGQCRTYSDLFGTWVQKTTGNRVVVDNLSQHDNLTAARMANELPQDHEQTQAVKSADIVLLDIGFNDTPWNSVDDACDGDHGFFDGNPKASWTALLGPCLQTEVRRYHANLDKILTKVDSLRAGRPTAVTLTTQYSDFGGPPGHICCPPIATKVAAEVKVAFNRVECEVAVAHHATCADLLHPFNGPKGTAWPGSLIGPDGTHPSAQGHQKIAELLEAAGIAPLSARSGPRAMVAGAMTPAAGKSGEP